jgi:hypothetical protein
VSKQRTTAQVAALDARDDAEHVHQWIADTQLDDMAITYACAECPETTHGCQECDKPLTTTLTICDRCLNRAKKIITDIQTAIETVPFHYAEIMGLRAIRYDRDKVTASNDPDRLPFGLDLIIEDPEDQRVEAAKHPNTAIDILIGWAQAWTDARESTTAPSLTYLVDHTLWAAQNPNLSGWDTYLREARQVRATIRRLLGIAPEHEPAPCVYCGGTIIREWLDDGLDDLRKCQQCGLTWPDEARLRYANRHTVINLRETRPDMLVTIEEAKAILPEARRGTLDTWARRGLEMPDRAKFNIRGRNIRGCPLYRLGDISDAWHAREQKLA